MQGSKGSGLKRGCEEEDLVDWEPERLEQLGRNGVEEGFRER